MIDHRSSSSTTYSYFSFFLLIFETVQRW